jgi:hypothetical protein
MPTKLPEFATLALLTAVVLAACGGGPDLPEPEHYSGLVVSSEFVPGPSRFPFGLVDVNGRFLEDAAVTVRFFSLDGSEATFIGEAPAAWRTIEDTTRHEHPDGEVHLHLDFRGIYVVDEIDLPAAGIFMAEFGAVAADGKTPVIEKAAFQVLSGPSAPGIGQPVPATENPTIHDVPFAELSTRRVESDEMHNLSVAQALETGAPFVVFFASPQFCVSAMCGPMTDAMEQAHDKLALDRGEGVVEFIHIEPWDLEAARERGELVPAPVVREWRLLSEPWAFVVGADGRVSKRFEGFVTAEEVLTALERLL